MNSRFLLSGDWNTTKKEFHTFPTREGIQDRCVSRLYCSEVRLPPT